MTPPLTFPLPHMTLQQVGGGRDLEYRGKVTIIFNFVEHFCRKGRETITKNDRQNCFEPLESVQDTISSRQQAEDYATR